MVRYSNTHKYSCCRVRILFTVHVHYSLSSRIKSIHSSSSSLYTYIFHISLCPSDLPGECPMPTTPFLSHSGAVYRPSSCLPPSLFLSRCLAVVSLWHWVSSYSLSFLFMVSLFSHHKYFCTLFKVSHSSGGRFSLLDSLIFFYVCIICHCWFDYSFLSN